ncbi:MAG: DUF6502 family protein [Steroidobacteraceae bacterium]
MSENFKATLLSAFRPLMRPLVRILVRNRVSYGEFAELLKSVFVDSAQDVLQLPDSRQSVSRIAITTGLTRLEVSRLLTQTDEDAEALLGRLSRVGRLLTGWHQDSDFTGPYGIPYEIQFEGPIGRRSFTELVRRYTSDVPADEMLDELKRIGAVLDLGNGYYRVLIRSYIPSAADPAKFHAMSVAFTDLAKTLDQNLRPDEDQKIFERRVWAPNGITPTDALDFDRYVKDRGQQFLESLDDWLSTRETEAARSGASQSVKVGVAMYMFVRPLDEQSDQESMQ